MIDTVCPKCGSPLYYEIESKLIFGCGTVPATEDHPFEQSELCRVRQSERNRMDQEEFKALDAETKTATDKLQKYRTLTTSIDSLRAVLSEVNKYPDPRIEENKAGMVLCGWFGPTGDLQRRLRAAVKLAIINELEVEIRRQCEERAQI